MKPGATVAWLNSAQAAAYLGFASTHAFQVWLSRQKAAGTCRLKVHWLAGRMRFRRVDLDACVEAEPETTTAPLRVVGGRR